MSELPAVEPVVVPAPPTTDDVRPARPTTRAGRRAAAEARRAAGKPDKPPRQPATPRTSSVAALGKQLGELHVMMGVGLSMAGRPVTGQALAENGEKIGAAWAQLAATNPAVRAALEKMLAVSAWGAVAGAYAPVVVAALAEGGKLPPAAAAMMGAPDVSLLVPEQQPPAAA